MMKQDKGQNGKKLNIAMIGHKRFPSREGGVEIVVKELAVRLVELGHGVTVYNRKGHHVSGSVYDDKGQFQKLMTEYQDVKVVTVPTIEKKGLAAVTSSFFATIRAAAGSYDIIHYHAEGPAAMLFIPHFWGKRTIVTIHGLDWMRSKWGGFAAWYLKLGEKIAAKYADEIIVLSRSVQQYFRTTYGRETTYIPNGMEREKGHPVQLIHEKWKLNKNSYILFLGRIVPEKGLDYLLEAWKHVISEKILVIAGGASDTDIYLASLQKRSEGDNRVLFTGFVQGQVLKELYSNAYLYVLPSDVEGMPLSLLEALSFGNCCVVSDIAECTEVVEDKAVIFRKGDSQDLKDKLEMLCNKPEMVHEYQKLANVLISRKCNWESVVESTLERYFGNTRAIGDYEAAEASGGDKMRKVI